MCSLVALGTLAAQTYAPGPQALTFHSDADDSDQPYALYLPKNYDAAKRYPLVVSLHGAWSDHRLNLKRVFGKGNRPGETDAEASRRFPAFPDVEFIVASPLARGTMGYQGLAEKDVYDMLADVRKRFAIDPDRIYLTGLSMGGGGALWLALTRPDLWAAVAAVCPAAPEGVEDLAPNALNIPIHLFHGEMDPVVGVDASRRWQKLLLNLDTETEYVEYPAVRHNAWDIAYRNAAIFAWFAQFRRNPRPDRVRFATRAYRYDRAYWVRIDGLTPGAPATIDARFTAANRVDVKTTGIDGFTLELEGHPKFAAARPLEVTVDGEAHTAPARRSVSFVKAKEGWIAGRYKPAETAKRPGLEGPLAEAIAGRHIYVYGTADNPAAPERERRQQEAEHAADWTSGDVKLLAAFRVLPDRDVKPEDAAGGNMVLFGTRATNLMVARLDAQLPMALNPGAADYGLVFIAPVNGRYVLVNSGLPWWTGADQEERPGLEFQHGSAWSVLGGFGDYILFKGSTANVVAAGRFDRDWKLPAAEAAKIRATGAVEVR
jgi:predicted esterase